MQLKVNGIIHDISDILPSSRALLYVLQDELGLTQTRLGCGVGACGLCRVLVDGQPLRSCILPVDVLEGAEIITIEGLMEGATDGHYQSGRALLKALRENPETNCRNCLHGQVVTAAALLEENPQATRPEIDAALEANFCYCNHYLQISDTIAAAAAEFYAPAPLDQPFSTADSHAQVQQHAQPSHH